MAGKVHTDSEALYAVRSAIAKFAGSFQEAQGNFSQCFERMNYQIEDYMRMLDSDIESCEEEKRVLQRQVEECEEKQLTAQSEQSHHQNGRTDSFVCDRCKTRMMLKIYGDSTSCKSSSGCSGTMHRVFNDGDYNRLNVEIQQLEEKKRQLQERITDLDERIRKREADKGRVETNSSELQMHQQSIMSLLVFGSGEDPETAVAFIDKALVNLGDYQGVTFDSDISSSNDEVQKKNELNEDASSQKDNDNSSTIDIQELLSKEQFSDDDRAAIRNAIMQGTIGEYEIRTIGARVKAKIDKAIENRRNEFEYLQKKRRELALAFNYATTDEERKKVATDSILLKAREQAYREKYGNSSMVKEAIASYRSVGPEKDDKGQSYDKGFFSSSKPVMDAIDSIREFLPTEWVNKSSSIPIITKHVNRGYFNMKDGVPTIALSTAGSGMQRCAFHEMGHFFEELYPEIRKLEYQFYNRRTAGEELRWLGAGYSRSEVTRYDNFIEPYMGKDYGNTETSGYELFSMGMESVFANSYDLSRDPEYQDFMFGILVSV